MQASLSSDIVLVEASFPKHTDLLKVSESLTQDCPFFCQTQVLSGDRILLTLEDVTDLLDIDLVNSYGAISIRIIDSKTELETLPLHIEKGPQIQKHSNMLQKQKMKNEWKKKESALDETSAGVQSPPRLERLTSLEDLVREEEKVEAYFDVFAPDHQGSMSLKTIEVGVKSSQTIESESESEEKINIVGSTTQEIEWTPVVGGVALAALFIGGYKAITTLFNS